MDKSKPLHFLKNCMTKFDTGKNFLQYISIDKFTKKCDKDMTVNSKVKYTTLRNGIYQSQIRVPKSIRYLYHPIIMIRMSLKTSDPEVARIRVEKIKNLLSAQADRLHDQALEKQLLGKQIRELDKSGEAHKPRINNSENLLIEDVNNVNLGTTKLSTAASDHQKKADFAPKLKKP